MITEQDVRAIYEGFYRIAENVGNGEYTSSLAEQLHDMLTNPDSYEEDEKIDELARLTLTIDFEYYTKLKNLAGKQMLEAQIK